MTDQVVLKEHKVGRMIDCTYQVQMRHVPDGIPVVSGLTFHVLEQVLPDGTLRLLARIDAILYASRATPILSWQITAPAFEYEMAHVWMAVRAFQSEGDCIDALWRLRGMAEIGLLPKDLRDVV